MSDVERDPRVANLFADVGDEVSRFIRPDGVAAVVTTVQHRRRNRVVGTAATLLVLVSASVAAAVHLTGTHQRDLPGGSMPSASAAASPPGTGSAAPSSPTSTPSAPDGRISQGQLANATLRIPPWPRGFDDGCATGTVTFTGGRAGNVALQGAPVYVDVDHDGAQETVALISCSPQGSDYKVLAFDRDASGHIVTLGQVVGSAGNQGREGVDIMTIWAVAAGDNGQVRVDVGEYRPCCMEAQASQHQWRAYGWNGQSFTQTGGPTAFGPNPKVTNLAVAAGQLTMTKQADGSWQGILHATIHNGANYPTPGLVDFSIGVNAGWQVQAAAGSGCRLNPGETPLECVLPVLATGADRVVNLTVTAPAGTSSGHCRLGVVAVDANRAGYPDRSAAKGRTTVPVILG